MANDKTTLLALPYLAAAQSQKHVTHNDALRMLDVLVQLSAKSASLAAPPSTPADGDRYIVPSGASGAFAGQAMKIAAYQDGAWNFFSPSAGWIAYVLDASVLRCFDGAAWQIISAIPTNVPLLGINATADLTSRLAVSAASTLLNHAGNGHQLKLNKASAADTASLLYQTGFSGRAEMGLAGDDGFHLKVSADGASWREALTVDRASGIVSFPQGAIGTPISQNLLINSDFLVNQRGFGGGALAGGAYGFDRWKAGAGGATLSRSGLVVTLSAGTIAQVIEPSVFGETSFASRTLTLSAGSLSGGSLSVTLGSASGVLAAGQSLSLSTAAGDTGNLALTLAIASGTPAFSRLRLEWGAIATGWTSRPAPLEMVLCQRYYETSVPAGQPPASYAPGAGNGSIYVAASGSAGSVTQLRYLVPKRVAPTVTIRDGAANANKISVYNGAWLNNYAFTGTLGATDKGLSLQQNNAGVTGVTFDFSVEAEL
ncbi:MAG: DUF2793 domain-containing protein [Beijerinckiaceae bacterium]|nr:DUF2793 domain-containing protein [Beijerinckiaceae bacterium]